MGRSEVSLSSFAVPWHAITQKIRVCTGHAGTEFHDAADQGMAAAARLQTVTMAATDTDASDQIGAGFLTDKTQKVG